MGVPKFYRWISERYPCLSEVVKEFQLPEFDNLYFDMNGIIHVCSHPDDENPHFRMSEEQMFKDICHYIEFLFRMIKPRKVFFMAVDGVAPRAKMNQQRGRRFRSAREAEALIEKAKEKGEVLPTEKRFDSNCITPGTPFMVRLQEHLKYFVVDKVSNDPLWQGLQVYLSGHETPGEGEHKIMDFIRYSKSQSSYDPDTRHCLYGLDADLIMLGLASHEPHFSLLREEVRFGGRKDQKNKRPSTPEETTFHLLHLSLLRDYLAYEFYPMKDKLPFEWNLEKIIDDWILMGFLVGNDFIPHLPHLHIKNDALPMLWRTYMEVLPTLDGYLNDAGHLNLPRFEKYLEVLSRFDHENFESAFGDFSALEEKIGGKSINESIDPGKHKTKMRKLKPFKMKSSDLDVDLESNVPLSKGQFEALSGKVDISDDSDDTGCDTDGEDIDEEENFSDGISEEEDFDIKGSEFDIHKRDYYMSKMNYKSVTSQVLEEQAYGYVIAIQWILKYYFDGCPSWSWYYKHHYAPYISDVKGFSKLKIKFDLSTPFLPFQQLMAVLPAASIDLIPPALQPLMTEAESPVIDFYPVNFETDLNGKQQDWEAVVVIPFINEERLLNAMASKDHLLTKEEKGRNRHGPHCLYQFTTESLGLYPSSMPGVFPDINLNRASLKEIHKDEHRIDCNILNKGLSEGFKMDVYFPGFPVLKFLPHTHELKKSGVKVFQHASRGENMVLSVKATPGLKLEDVAKELLGKSTYVGWPHIHEAKVVGVANESVRLEIAEESPKKGEKKETTCSFRKKDLSDEEAAIVYRESNTIKERHIERFGIDVGNTEIIVYACPVTGRNYAYGSSGMITLEKQFAPRPTPFAHQMTIKDLQVEESAHTTFKTLDEVYPEGATIFMLGLPHYGAQGIVRETLAEQGRVRISLSVTEEPDFQRLSSKGRHNWYLPPNEVAVQLGIHPFLLSRITGSVFVERRGTNGGRVNVGLNLKFTKRREEVPDYTCFKESGWTYSQKCADLVKDYLSKFSDVWINIEKAKKGTDVYSEADLIQESCSFTLDDVKKWLDELPSAKAPRHKFGTQILTDREVAILEETTDALNKRADIVKIKVKPRLLFRPMPNQGTLVPDPDANFLLYDRVVVVKSGYSVPFGKRGTIVGVPSPEEEEPHAHTVYEVVFDEPFPGGLSERCSANKGYRVPGSAMLNITYGEFRKNWKKAESTDRLDFWQRQQAAKKGDNTASSPRSYQGYNNRDGGHSSRDGGYNKFGGYNNRDAPYNNRDTGYNNRDTGYNNRDAGFRQQQGHNNRDVSLRPHQGFNNNNMGMGCTGSRNNDRAGSYNGRGGPYNGPGGPYNGPAGSHQQMPPHLMRQQVAWDNKKRPMFGQVFSSGGHYVQQNDNQLKYVTPKVQTPPTVTRSKPQQAKEKSVVKSDNSEFEKMWKDLQKHQQHTSGTDTSKPDKEEPLATEVSKDNDPQPPGLMSLMGPSQVSDSSSVPKTKSPIPAQHTDDKVLTNSVQNLFDNASKVKESVMTSSTDTDQFLSMFNTLTIHNSQTGIKTEQSSGHLTPVAAQPSSEEVTSQSNADEALKQLLKIGIDKGPSTSPRNSRSPSLQAPVASAQSSENISKSPVIVDKCFMEQPPAQNSNTRSGVLPSANSGLAFSVQELFKEADRQQKVGNTSGILPPSMSAPQQGMSKSSSASSSPRDHPVTELANYCRHNFNQPPSYEYKLQSKQMTYIANVILPNGRRFEGSQCKEKDEAAKSAAGMALLCLKSKPNTTPVMPPGFPPGVHPGNMNRFFSPNSAFSPIGMPGATPGLMTRPPPTSLLLTPQHFLSQPPPPIPRHQMNHQQQHMMQQNFNQDLQRKSQQPVSPRPSQSQMYPTPVSLSQPPPPIPQTTTVNTSQSSSTKSQQFIPLQVTKKMPSKKKDNEDVKSKPETDEPVLTTESNKSSAQIIETQQTSVLSETQGTHQPSVSLETKPKTGEQITSETSTIQKDVTVTKVEQESTAGAEADLKSDSTASEVKAPVVKPVKKKKSRLAANFSKPLQK